MSVFGVMTALVAAAGAAAGGSVLLERTSETLVLRRLHPRRRTAWIRLGRRPRATGELPSLLLDVAAGLRSGLDLPMALRHASGNGRLGARLRQAVEAYDLGASLEDALQSVLAPEGDEGQAVARVFQVHGRTGGQLAPMLVVMAEALERRRLVHREMAARSAEARYSAALLASLPPLLLLGLSRWAPAMAEPLWRTGIGHAALLYAGVSWALGVACCVVLLSPLHGVRIRPSVRGVLRP